MRLFTAIDLPPSVVRELERLIQALRPAAKINWSRASNLHLTTKFIGDWPDARLEQVKEALASVVRRDPLPIEVRGLGWFPNERNPHVFWAGVQAPPGLAELARDTEAVLEPLGIAPEGRAFSPHLTLARIKAPAPLEPLRNALNALPSTEFGSFTAEAFFLYQSQLQPGGSIYTKRAEFPFGRRA